MFRVIDNFSAHKDKSQVVYSDPLFTSKGGFMFSFYVYPNGSGSGKGTHLTVGFNLMKGPNDDHLQFPVAGFYTITLMNWKEDKHHVTRYADYSDNMLDKYNTRVTKGEKGACWGLPTFLSHSELERTDVQFVKDDKICFKISFQPLLSAGKLTS